MTLDQKRWLIGGLGLLFLLSLVAVQWLEVSRRRHEAGDARAAVVTPAASRQCVDCHTQVSTGIVEHWTGSTHAEKGVACVDCHQAEAKDADVFSHYGRADRHHRDAPRLRALPPAESAEFAASHHAKAGNILASLDNFLAETVEGSRVAFSPHSPTPGKAVAAVNGLAPANSGCQQCHGSLVAFQATDGGLVTTRDLVPDERRPAHQSRRGRPHRAQRERQAALQQHELAQYRHRPPESRRLARVVLGVPQPPRLLGPARPSARELRQVPPRARTIRRRRSTTSRSTAWPSATSSAR